MKDLKSRYSRLTVVTPFVFCSKISGEKKRKVVEVICKCGVKKMVDLSDLKNKKIKSCGCLKMEKSIKQIKKNNVFFKKKGTYPSTTHGMSKTSTYTAYKTMKSRCKCETNHKYPIYGGRGITYDPRWEKFENFLEDMGERPEGKSLDRIDNNGNYCKENCRWASPKEQANNTRRNRILFYNKKRYTLQQFSEKFNTNYSTLRGRIRKAISVNKSTIEHNGQEIVFTI